MSFDWAEYLNVAQELADQPAKPANAEAKHRAAISRAYYAAFGIAKNHLRDKDKDSAIPMDGTVHRYVIDRFRLSTERQRKNIGNDLGRLREWRRQADYDDSLAKPHKIAEIAILVAQTVLRNLMNLQQ